MQQWVRWRLSSHWISWWVRLRGDHQGNQQVAERASIDTVEWSGRAINKKIRRQDSYEPLLHPCLLLRKPASLEFAVWVVLILVDGRGRDERRIVQLGISICHLKVRRPAPEADW